MMRHEAVEMGKSILYTIAILFTIAFIWLVFGCGGGSTAIKPDIVETKTVTTTVTVPVPVPCFRPEDVPVLPQPTKVDTEHATTDQLAAARARDAEAFQKFSEAVAGLFAGCTIKPQEGSK